MSGERPSPAAGPARVEDLTASYLICCTPRTGSWLLTEGLAETAVAGRPDEFFSNEKELDLAGGSLTPAPAAVARWLRSIRSRGTTANGVLGMKAHLDQLEHLAFRLALLPEVGGRTPAEALDWAFGRPAFVWSRRRDTVRQAVSWWRSLQTGVWFDVGDQASGLGDPPRFDFEAVRILHHRILAQEATWSEFFARCGRWPLVVEYEELASDYPEVLSQVLDFLGVRLPAGRVLPPPRLRQQADTLSEEWVRAFHERTDGAFSQATPAAAYR